jgi:hypothetical protein
MEQWSVVHRVFPYGSFDKNNELVVKVQHVFRINFNIGRHDAIPDRKTIIRWVTAFQLLQKKPSGSVRTMTTPENMERVRAVVLQSPRRSVLKQAQILQINRSSIRRIIKRELNFHPYKLTIVLQLKPTDYYQRSEFALEMLSLFEVNDDMLLFISDEAHFHLDDIVNKQNVCYYAAKNPQNLHERPLHSSKVTV